MANNLRIHWLSLSRARDGIGLSRLTIAKMIFFGLPALLLLGAYIHMVFQYDKIWLFNTIVHENGKYSLIKVIFYFRHFTWETPIKTWYAILIAGLFFFFGKPLSNQNINTEKDNFNHLIAVGLCIAVGTAVVAVCFTGFQVGLPDALKGLLQYRTSEVRSIDFGSHWRNHLLSNIVLLTTSTAAVIFYRLWIFGNWTMRRYGIIFPFAIALFTVITIAFGLNFDPFTKPSYLGHQLREIFGTDLPITMLLSMGVLSALEDRYDKINRHEMVRSKKAIRNGLVSIVMLASVAILISGFLVVSVLNLNISGEISKLGHGGQWSKLDLFAWHFFEHSLDYIFTTALVGATYLILLKFEKKRLLRQS